MSNTLKFTLILSVFALVGLLFVATGCEDNKPSACCGQPDTAGCCASAEDAHGHPHDSEEGAPAKCCGEDPSKCCGKKVAEAAGKCCGDDPSKCCGSKK